jgi:hypothetical protein
MKKFLPLILVVAAAAAAAFFFLRKRPEADMPPGRAAELAPPETLLFIEFPDIPRTLRRWEKTSLHDIAQEPEWKEFTAKVGDYLTTVEEGGMFMGVWEPIREADPSGMFLAFTAFDGPFPKFVGGFPYRGKKSAVQSGIGKLRGLITKGFPAAKSDLVQHEGTDIETLTDRNFSAVFAYRDNWFFFGSDLELMKGTLRRYAAGANAPPGLGKDPLYQEALKQGWAEPDFTAYFQWRKMMGDLFAMGAAAGSPLGGLPPPVEESQPLCISYTLKLDGPLMRDRIYMHQPGRPVLSPMENRLLAATGGDTYAYFALSAAGWERHFDRLFSQMDEGTMGEEDRKRLAAKGLRLKDVPATFGPEIAMQSDWEPAGLYPTFFASVEVRDPAKARKFAEFLVEEIKKEGQLSQKEEDGTTYWTLSFGLPVVQPTIAVNQKHLAVGLNYAMVYNGLKQMKTSGASLAQRPAYQGALETVFRATNGIMYLDLKILFERLYERFKPFLAFEIAGDETMAKYFDPMKFPRAATISKHLRPIVATYSPAPQGLILDCSGSLSMGVTFMPLLPAGAFYFWSSSTGSAAPSRTGPSPGPPK